MPSGQQRIFTTKLTDVDTIKKEQLGVIRWEGNKCYKYVKIQNTTATVAGVAGDPVAYGAATGYTNNLVVIDLSDADASFALPAGVLVGSVTGTAGTAYYGWIQIKGPATVVTAIAGTPADGDLLELAATDKTVQKRTVVDNNIFGYAIDASAKTVSLDCLF